MALHTSWLYRLQWTGVLPRLRRRWPRQTYPPARRQSATLMIQRAAVLVHWGLWRLLLTRAVQMAAQAEE